jgi:hypothetical protein
LPGRFWFFGVFWGCVLRVGAGKLSGVGCWVLGK